MPFSLDPGKAPPGDPVHSALDISGLDSKSRRVWRKCARVRRTVHVPANGIVRHRISSERRRPILAQTFSTEEIAASQEWYGKVSPKVAVKPTNSKRVHLVRKPPKMTTRRGICLAPRTLALS